MNPKKRVLACALPLALLCASARADDDFCNRYVAQPHPTYFQCVQTTVSSGGQVVINPDQAGPDFVTASRTGADAAGFTSASASASPGLLRAKAFAQTIDNPYAQAFARSDAWFADGGVVIGAPNVPIGTPVSLRFTIDVAGLFSGGGPFTALSEATIHLWVTTTPAVALIVNTGTLIHKNRPQDIVWTDIAGLKVGDSFDMLMKLHVSAGAVSGGDPANMMSLADVSNTGHLYVDVLSANASVVGASGYLYATPVPVPEPSTQALFAAGLAGLLWWSTRQGGRQTA